MLLWNSFPAADVSRIFLGETPGIQASGKGTNVFPGKRCFWPEMCRQAGETAKTSGS